MVEANKEKTWMDYRIVVVAVVVTFVMLNQMQWQGKDIGTMSVHKHL